MSDDTPVAADRILAAMLTQVPFDGWSETAFAAAIADTGADPGHARALFPRGPVDLALAHHEAGDRAMLARLEASDLDALRFRDRIARAVRFRLEVLEDREVVRRASALFSLPQNAAAGARAIWNTSDRIWTALGDTSDDYNWYTKRATLSAVYSATLLFWLGDDSDNHARTWEFLDRRIENVMAFEKLKADIRANPMLKPLLAAPDWLLSHVHAPAPDWKSGFPGRWTAPRG